EEGKVTLRVWTKEKRGDDFTMFVSVKDTGIGIRPEDREKLFESFTRLDETRNRNIEGTGLGMSVVTRLLEMMGSSLQVESEYGVGSVFSFELKQGIVDQTPIGNLEEGMKQSLENEEEEKFLYATGARVLLVDDNSMNLKVARNLMKRNGIVPDEALSGIEAIELVKEKVYDMILLDHMMPKMDGIETMKKMRSEGLIPENCVVIALTANAISGSKEKYLEAGFDDYLSKPIDVAQMEKKFYEWLPKGKLEWRESTNNVKTEEVVKAPVDVDFDREAGLDFCSWDQEFFREILSDFVEEYQEKIKTLEEDCQEENWFDFEVKMHGLKSTARSIGAGNLAKEAQELEEVAAQEAGDLVREKYPTFARDYRDLVNRIREEL
ncbi:MAG: response regulator, partial [Eubacterium sp.]|nr:response regulator [Eubacterium sp.]